jgi:hypothetical protein
MYLFKELQLNNMRERAGGVAQVTEYLPSKNEALSSSLNCIKIKQSKLYDGNYRVLCLTKCHNPLKNEQQSLSNSSKETKLGKEEVVTDT